MVFTKAFGAGFDVMSNVSDSPEVISGPLSPLTGPLLVPFVPYLPCRWAFRAERPSRVVFWGVLKDPQTTGT